MSRPSLLKCPSLLPAGTTSSISQRCNATFARLAWSTSRRVQRVRETSQPRDDKRWYLRLGLACVVSSASICLVISRRSRPVSSNRFCRCILSCISPFSYPVISVRHPPQFIPVSFPSQIASIYSSVVMLQCRHFPFCMEMPESVRDNLEMLRKGGNNVYNNASSNRRDYWSESARSAGLFDTDVGVQFCPRVDDNKLSSKILCHENKTVEDDDTEVFPESNAAGLLPRLSLVSPFERPSANHTYVYPESNAVGAPRLNFVSPFDRIAAPRESISHEQLVRGSTLVTQLIRGSTLLTLEDRDLVPDHIFLSLAQLVPCQLTAEDRIGAYRARPIGFKGLCCRYCQGYQPGPGEFTGALIGQNRNLNTLQVVFASMFSSPGFGKFFPNSLRSLSQTTTASTIIKHITSKCTHVPRNVKVR